MHYVDQSSLSKMDGLKGSEIYKIVYDYIGVSGGYLGDFSYNSHKEFYPRYCDLEINPFLFDGTTKERFIHILENSDPAVQAKIVRGVLAKYRLSYFEQRDQLTKAEIRTELEEVVERLEVLPVNEPKIHNPTLNISSDVVERAISDAETLLRENGAISGIDRIHTSLHGFLIAVCQDAKLMVATDASLPSLFNIIVRDHPSFQNIEHRDGDILKILRAFGAVLDSLGPVRNMASMAHPNKKLLGEDEAWLVIHAGRTILHYLDAKLSNMP